MKNYMETVNLKRTTLTLIASRIPEDQITALRETFQKFDTDGNGKLTVKELREGMQSFQGCGLSNEEMEKAVEIMDSNQNGVIDYTEFIAGCL